MSDSNRISYAVIEESTYGEDPGSGTPGTPRWTSDSLAGNTSYTRSNELRSDGQVADRIRTDRQASGATNFEFSIDDGSVGEDLLRAAIRGASATAAVTVSGATLAIVAADQAITDSGSGFANIAVGDWIRLKGWTAANNNGYFKVTAKPGAGEVRVATGSGLTDESGGVGKTITRGKIISNGTTDRSFTIHRKYEDLTNAYAHYLGMVVQTMDLSIAADQIITGSFGWLGKLEKSATAGIAGGTSPSAASTTPVLNGIDYVKKVVVGGEVFGDMRSFSLQTNINPRARKAIGQLGAISIGRGSIEVTGSLEAYFEDQDAFDDYLNDTPSSLAFALEDADENAMVIEIPKMKFETGQRVGGGINTDVVAQLTWGAYLDDVTGKTIRTFHWTESN